ncbi:competence protein ComEC [Dongia mobilis]|uniref:Competence protein ComEC n=1 Tax=Dongia mobilis TaxID=578943 RepID=A0A4R6WDF5_9PROT|nr:ComEC/Rec2 family competence protein [Dongia mobilis]TDQ77726.1 competence protein ComEC [Dongia mobilis]
MAESLLARAEAFIAAQRPNWPGWAATMLGIGVALYFALPVEPPLWWGIAAAGVSLILAVALRRRALVLLVLAAVTVAALGFAAATLRTITVEAPQLYRSLYRAEVTGRVLEIELLPRSQRVVFDSLAISSEKTGLLPPGETPERVRIRLARVVEPLRIGDWVRLTADLQPPSPPAIPGGFDFRRQAYFEGLGGVGFSLQPPLKIPPPPETGFSPVAAGLAWFDALRLAIGERLQAQLPGPTAGMAMALMVGNQRALTAADVAAMRDSGLAHLTSISGLHIGLAAGIFFFGLRAALALIPPLALRYDIKKWAAVFALAGAAFYAGLAGLPVPTQRALLMSAVFFIAILVDRSPISLRAIAVAAIIVLLWAPEVLVGASFQMSFAAVLGLICAFEATRGLFTRWRQAGQEAPDFLGRLVRVTQRGSTGLAALILSSLVATVMTAPYAAYHFDRLAVYGIAANMLAVPLTGFWVMPWAVIVLIAMPFGLEAWPLVALGWGCDGIIRIAHFFADLPGATLLVPAMPVWGLLAMSAGLIWLCLVIGRGRWLGLAILLVGVMSPLTHEAPDILASGNGKLVAVKDAEGNYRFNSGRAARIAAETWLRRNAQTERLPFPVTGTGSAGGDSCGGAMCRFATTVGYVTVALNETGIAPACWSGRLVIALEPVDRPCPSAERVIDFFDLWRHGTHAIWMKADGSYRIERAFDTGERPWKLQRFPKGRSEPETETPATAAAGAIAQEDGLISTDASGR